MTAPVMEETPPPKLRVRRLSGDKLSGTDAENILPQPAVEGKLLSYSVGLLVLTRYSRTSIIRPSIARKPL
jgi:hypothetical protein